MYISDYIPAFEELSWWLAWTVSRSALIRHLTTYEVDVVH